MSKRFRPTPAGGVAALALLLAICGGALAAGYVGGGKIQGCVGKNGMLSVVKPGKKCSKRQTSLAFAQTGPRGSQGAQGSKGATGPTGPDTGAAGGVLSGKYPDPGVNPALAAGCAGGSTSFPEAITAISNAGQPTCSDIVGTQFSARVNAVLAHATQYGPASGFGTGGTEVGAGSGSSSLVATGTSSVYSMNAVSMSVFVGQTISGVAVTLVQDVPISTGGFTQTNLLTCTTDATGTCSVLDPTAITPGALLAIQVANPTGSQIDASVGWFATTDPLDLSGLDRHRTN